MWGMYYCPVFFFTACIMVWWHISGYFKMFIVTVASPVISELLR